MLKIKTGVQPKILNIVAACINTAIEMDLKIDIVITSGNDSKHMQNSKHYLYQALDVRSKTFKTDNAKMIYLNKVLARLGPDYQGILESLGKPNEHFHFEYDPN